MYLIGADVTPATGGIAGTATLDGKTNHSGIKVTAYPTGAYVYTDESGAYGIEKLTAGIYTVEATKGGWVPAIVEGIVVQNDQQTAGVDLILYPRGKGGG